MQQPSQAQFLGEISASTAMLAEIASSCDNELPVPSCPDWTLRQLATHVGRVHRWAGELVRTRAQEMIAFNAVPDGRYPAEAGERAAWLTAGAARVIEAIADAGDAPVWAFGAIAPAGFWARRQAHETMVHRADAELAAGRPVALDQYLAADGIDEWLSMATRGGTSEVRPLPAGARLQLTATGSGVPDSTVSWLISGTEQGLALSGGAGQADVSVAGPADKLLLVLLRRLAADEPAVSVTGEASLFSGWLAGTPF